MTQNESGVAGKTALITGAAHRIGAQTARALHGAGMNILIHYLSSRKQAAALKQELESQRPESVVLAQADLNDINQIPRLIESAVETFSGLDVLVNNASSFYPTPLEDASEEQWNDLIGSNLKAPFFLAQAAAPLLRARRGCIVNLVDIHSLRPLKEYPIYSIAKAANAMLVKSLARELGPEVRVNGVSPGAILWPKHRLSPQTKQEILARTALKRAGAPEDIARTVLFLVRDAPYITGQVIAVDGGRTLQQ